VSQAPRTTERVALVVATLALHVGLGPAASEPAAGFVPGMRATFALFAVLCVVGALASLARGPRPATEAG
jgi:hypothetical protein